MKTYTAFSTILFLGLAFCASPDKSTETASATEVAPSLEHYLEAQSALAADDLETARQALQRLAQASQGELAEAARLTAETDDLEEIRSRFVTISQYAIENYDLPPGLMVAHCPMAGDEGANWIQRQGEIRNPYMGSSMLTCGVPVEAP